MSTHEVGRNGMCIDCMKSAALVETPHSICWACGHDIDHSKGHDCWAREDV